MYTCKHCGNTVLVKSNRCIVCGSRFVTHHRPRRYHQLTEHIFYEVIEDRLCANGPEKCLSRQNASIRERFSPASMVRRTGAKLKAKLSPQQLGIILSISTSLGLSLLISFLLL